MKLIIPPAVANKLPQLAQILDCRIDDLFYIERR